MGRLRLFLLAPLLYAPLALTPSCSLANQPADKLTGAAACGRPLTTLQDCGSCGKKCAPGNVDGASCDAGSCAFAKCKAGFLDCDNDKSNGCELDGNKDAGNCGSCGKACGAGATCLEGTCCAAGSVTCGGKCVDPQADAAHCGNCMTSCPTAANADPACTKGSCALQCKPSFADCGGGTKDGCETNTSNDKAHCGSCDVSCPTVDKTTTDCKDSKCAISSCAAGFEDCDKKVDNGCEADLSQPMTCGTCVNSCKAGEGCNSGQCLGGVTAFGEFRPALKCADFKNNGSNLQKYCFTLKGKVLCTGQFGGGKADCTDTAKGGVSFLYDVPATWPMRFTPNTQDCMNYSPAFIQNFALAIGYAKYTIKQTKPGNSCTRT